MSLLHLVHRSVLIKFADCAKDKFNPETSYVFRLTGVDAMGFLQVQELKGPPGHEATSEPYWINKDLVREIHEVDLTKLAEQAAPKAVKPKAASKPRTALKPKPILG